MELENELIENILTSQLFYHHVSFYSYLNKLSFIFPHYPPSNRSFNLLVNPSFMNPAIKITWTQTIDGLTRLSTRDTRSCLS